jgi:hypothetical protein
MKALFIPVEGPTHVVDLDLNPAMRSARNLVGGWVELVHIPGKVLLVDEDGNMKNLPLNPRASEIAGQRIRGQVVAMGWTRADFADWPELP